MTEKRCFIIGDSHGHVNRLDALLLQEDILADCGLCEGTGDNEIGDLCEVCEVCDGTGLVRNYENDVRVIHIGDLMHGGIDQIEGDKECYTLALTYHWIDDVIWGNHERGVLDGRHAFGGMARTPAGPTIKLMNEMERQGRMHFALAVHGFLLTHAGLGSYWESSVSDDLDRAVDRLNQMASDPNRHVDNHTINAVSYRRGGRSPAGGILWRDDSEPISGKFNQVYGHTADRDGLHRTHRTGDKVAYKIDIGGKTEQRLGGLWLPDQTLVKVELGLKS